MRITALEEYGLRCMVRLAGGKALTLAEMSEHEGLSIPYAAKLLSLLKQGGLVVSQRGRNGGYALALEPKRISLKMVFDALGEPLFSPEHCERFGLGGEGSIPCVHSGHCPLGPVWGAFQRITEDVLSAITLADIVGGKRKSVSSLLAMAGIERTGSRTGGKGQTDTPIVTR